MDNVDNEEKQIKNELLKTYNHASNYFINNQKEIKNIINFFSNISEYFNSISNKAFYQNDFQNIHFI